jgi:hypothetical protein
MAELSKYEAVRPYASRYGEMYSAAEEADFLRHLTTQQLGDLRAAYSLLATLSDARSLSSWIDHCARCKDSVSRPELTLSRQIAKLLVLFEHLSEMHISPFDSGRVVRIQASNKPDWETLPVELAYLIDVATRYRTCSTDLDKAQVLERATQEDLETLACCAEMIRVRRHYPLINHWLDSAFACGNDDAAWMIYNLIGLLDLAGLEVEARDIG